MQLAPKVVTKYPEEVRYVLFSDFENWEGFEGYAYVIKSNRIQKALKLLENPEIFNLIESEIHGDWQDATKLTETMLIPESLKHPCRIAYLVKQIQIDGVEPVSIDTYSNAPSYTEGHHRLLAMKYIGYLYFPAYISGTIDCFPINCESLPNLENS